jgi:hypothetical protein
MTIRVPSDSWVDDNGVIVIRNASDLVALGMAVIGCPVGVAVRDAVYITGADTVDQADASSAVSSPAVGLVRAKPTATTALVQTAGELPGFVGLTPGVPYYISGTTPGAITAAAPGGGNAVQVVGFARNTTTLIVLILPIDVLTI